MGLEAIIISQLSKKAAKKMLSAEAGKLARRAPRISSKLGAEQASKALEARAKAKTRNEVISALQQVVKANESDITYASRTRGAATAAEKAADDLVGTQTPTKGSKGTREAFDAAWKAKLTKSRTRGEYQQTAEAYVRAEKRFETRQANADLVRRSQNPYDARTLTKEERAKALTLRKAALREQIKRTEAEMGEETFATAKAKKMLSEMPPASKLNHNQLARKLGQLDKIDKWTTLTPEGARKQEQMGVKFFGDQWGQLKLDEKTAVWDEVHRMMAGEYGHRLGSQEAIDKTSELSGLAPGSSELSILFHRDDNGSIVSTTIAASMSAAEMEAARERARTRTIDAYSTMKDEANVFHMFGPKDDPRFTV